MRFVAVARVTEQNWVACSVLDDIHFGLRPGDELELETTICHEIRGHHIPVVIDHVAEDVVWSKHPTPKKYGFQSYISMPIVLGDGSFFGTLCAIDPQPRHLRTPETTAMFRLFAELIAKHLDGTRKLVTAETALTKEREDSELRDQFIAVLAHDLRSPMRAIRSFTQLLLRTPLDERAISLATVIRDSAVRMQSLIDNLLDLARGQMGGGLGLQRDADKPLEPVLREVIAELQAGHPDRVVDTVFQIAEPIDCDRTRIAQLFSNLLGNAITYGSLDRSVRVEAFTTDDEFELSVANGGEPIPPAAMERLFQPFYRSAVQQNREGLGLGLYIANEIATAHGGTLTVRSTEDETCFIFRMPLRR